MDNEAEGNGILAAGSGGATSRIGSLELLVDCYVLRVKKVELRTHQSLLMRLSANHSAVLGTGIIPDLLCSLPEAFMSVRGGPPLSCSFL